MKLKVREGATVYLYNQEDKKIEKYYDADKGDEFEIERWESDLFWDDELCGYIIDDIIYDDMDDTRCKLFVYESDADIIDEEDEDLDNND